MAQPTGLGDAAAMKAKAEASLQKNQNNALVKATMNTKREIAELLSKNKAQIQAALPKHVTIDRLIRVALTAISRNPKLLECTQTSLLGAIIQSAQLGLEPDGALGHAYLIPFKNNNAKTSEVLFMIGYRGFIDLARRSGQITTIMSNVVHEGDEFSYEYGLHQDLKHVPSGDKSKKLTHVYGYALMKDGSFQFEVMAIDEVQKIRSMSRAKDSGPWTGHFDEMARKTAIRRLAKYLPLSPEFATALKADEMADLGGVLDISGLTEDGEMILTAPEEQKQLPEDTKKGDKPDKEPVAGAQTPAGAILATDASQQAGEGVKPEPEKKKSPEEMQAIEAEKFAHTLQQKIINAKTLDALARCEESVGGALTDGKIFETHRLELSKIITQRHKQIQEKETKKKS